MKQIIVDNQVTSYYIDECGRCFNSKTNKYLKGQISNSGYLNYNLSITSDIKKRLYAHRLVAQYYLNDGQRINNNLEVNHIDGNKLNNHYENLELISHIENLNHAVDNGLIQSKCIFQFDETLRLIKRYDNIREVVNQTRYNYSVIKQEVLSNKKKITYGYYWSYKDTITKNEVIHFKNTGKSKIVYQYDLNNNFIAEYSSTGDAARKNFPELKRASSHIGECCRNRIKTYKGFVWKYKEDIV